MPVYVWKGKNIHGEKRKGQMEAVDEAGVRAAIPVMPCSPAIA